MYRWTVFKRVPHDERGGSRKELWERLGELETEYSIGPNAKQLGDLGGPGAYIALCDDVGAYRLEVEQEVSYLFADAR